MCHASLGPTTPEALSWFGPGAFILARNLNIEKLFLLWSQPFVAIKILQRESRHGWPSFSKWVVLALCLMRAGLRWDTNNLIGHQAEYGWAHVYKEGLGPDISQWLNPTWPSQWTPLAAPVNLALWWGYWAQSGFENARNGRDLIFIRCLGARPRQNSSILVSDLNNTRPSPVGLAQPTHYI